MSSQASLALVRDDEDLIASLDGAHLALCQAEYRMLRLAAKVEDLDIWRQEGARDGAHWLSMRYGFSEWKARRYIAAGIALARLPELRAALCSGRIGIDKTLELTRFATQATEAGLISWATGVNTSTVRRRADLALRTDIQEERDAQAARFANWWWFDEGRRLGIEAEFPAAQGAVIVKTLTEFAATIPVAPGEDDDYFIQARRADALYALAASRGADGGQATTMVVHVELSALKDATQGAQVAGGPVLYPQTAQRLACNSSIQTIVEAPDGQVAYVGRMRRVPSAWMIRQVRYRDEGCVFPGCGAIAFTEAHHIRFWSHGGRTDLSNLALICSFHHRLVHEDGWSMARGADQHIRWRRPNGQPFGPQVELADTS